MIRHGEFGSVYDIVGDYDILILLSSGKADQIGPVESVILPSFEQTLSAMIRIPKQHLQQDGVTSWRSVQ